MREYIQFASASEHRLCWLKENVEAPVPNDRAEVIARTETELKELMRVPVLDHKKDSLWIKESFTSMNGISKLALGAGALYLLVNYRKLRDIGIASVVGLLLFRLFAGKEISDRSREWIFDSALSLQEKIKGDPKQILLQRISADAEKMVGFFEPHDREGIEEQATGFALLADAPLRDLARNFDASDPDMANWELELAPGSDVDRQLQKSAKKYPMGIKYRMFFGNPDNQRQMSEGLTYTFYQYAIKNDTTGELAKKAATEVEIPKRSEGIMNYPDLKGPARTAYADIARKGREMALVDSKLLGSFIVPPAKKEDTQAEQEMGAK